MVIVILVSLLRVETETKLLVKHILQQRTQKEQESITQNRTTVVYLVQDQFDPYIQGRDNLPSYSSLSMAKNIHPQLIISLTIPKQLQAP